MIRTLTTLLGIHAKPDATSTELEAALKAAHAEVAAAGLAHTEAEAAYRAGLLRLEEGELHALITDAEAATVRRDRAAALVDALTARLAQARTSEDEAGRRARYEAAARAQAAAAKVLAVEYPKLAAALVDVLRTIAEADVLAQAANAALPEGAERLPSVETRVRCEPNVPERITAQEDFSAWCRLGGTRLHPDDQPLVKPGPDGVSGTWKPIGGEPVPVVLRRFRRVTRVPEAFGLRASALAATLNLPGLRASHDPFWTAGAEEDPIGIVAAIAASAPRWGKSRGPTVLYEPMPQVEIIALDTPADEAA